MCDLSGTNSAAEVVFRGHCCSGGQESARASSDVAVGALGWEWGDVGPCSTGGLLGIVVVLDT